ncbi:MAG: glutathione-disulfide reductase [Xanthobacteraceae bacterium]|nr:glutathione-disulfide reductase [Xanthobacteraceae bacterium]MBX3522924.1 glutathione-disulfide reductase [Xanthobacteraceae bacterium]MBX3535173.1 glutathione-disulfide reductase [Xanthobacteraceae bacterium]MBX3550260.1 glutathione-disulfide reductase [Xanthobacteraceae bacterium]MCW5677984.1 glutathione-disulfide reductase [Xanthobacteraceae bacterium]
MADFDLDLFVIGGGSGGVRAARIAATHGARVAIAEEYRMGGTCVIRGCVPKKLLVYASRFAHEFEDAAGFGWTVEGAKFDWPTLIANKDKEIARLEAAYRRNVGGAGAEIIDSRVVIEGPNTVRILKTGATLNAKYILVATGGHPSLLDIPGKELGITSNEAFHLKELPRRIVIQGGGFIAVEFACLFAGLGSKVTLVHRGDEILRGFDDDLRAHVRGEMVARGIDVRLNDTIQKIEDHKTHRCAFLSDGAAIEADQVMLAVGRSPNTKNIGLEAAGVKLAPSGAVAVDETSRSNVPSIYAIGDVSGRIALTPVAIREGHAVADTLFGNKPWNVDHKNVPSAVFSEPEIGTVGLSEVAAKKTGKHIDIYRTRFKPMKATLSGRDTAILMKLVVEQSTEKVLGVHIVGEGAAEMAQLAAIAVKMGATKQDFDNTVALHPTAAEELVTLRNKVAD